MRISSVNGPRGKYGTIFIMKKIMMSFRAAAGRFGVRRPVEGGAFIRASVAVFIFCAAVIPSFGESAGGGARPAKWATPVECAGVPNLHRISDSLYRSAQPTAEGMTNLVALGIKTVVNLREYHSDDDEIGALPLKARRIKIFTGNMKDEYVDEFLAVLADTNAVPVLVHCMHGSDRTGTVCAMYRVICEGWSAEDAIEEMREGGYGFHRIWTNLPRFIRRSAKARGR